MKLNIIKKKVNYLSFLILLAGILFISGCAKNGNVSCPNTAGMTACGYCKADASLSDNPNAGQCRYCPSDAKCSYTDICGELKCTRDTNSVSGNGLTVTSPELQDATVGIFYSYSFATRMDPSGGNPPYTFYLGSGVGFPPTGLTLNTNGILSGTPTVKGTSKFEVCIKDLGGNQACKMVSMKVGQKEVSVDNSNGKIYDGTYTGTFKYEYRKNVYDKDGYAVPGEWTPASFNLTITLKNLGDMFNEGWTSIGVSYAQVSDPVFGAVNGVVPTSLSGGKLLANPPAAPAVRLSRQIVDEYFIISFPNNADITIPAYAGTANAGGKFMISSDGSKMYSSPDYPDDMWSASASSGPFYANPPSGQDYYEVKYKDWSLTKVSS